MRDTASQRPAKPSAAPTYPLSALRATVLHAQRLSASNEASPPVNAKTICDLVRALGYIQIDTLSVVNRAHYVTLWARFGSYDIASFNNLIYANKQRKLYEGWGHAASIIPFEHYRYHRWRRDPKVSYNPCFVEWLKKPVHAQLADQILVRVREQGAVRVGEVESEGTRSGVWYDWKPSKMALEALFARGDLMVADREKFQRIYDLRERVVPKGTNLTSPDPDTARKYCLEHAAKALGVFEARHLTFYAYMKATPARPLIAELIRNGTLVEIRGESMNGTQKWLIHRENLTLLEQAANGEITANRTTFLAPFDSVLWAPGRDQKLWGFKHALECYKPQAARKFGYFCFPILYKDRLIGRFDPKLDRKSGLLRLNALYLEPGINPDAELVACLATAMRDFLVWHGAKDLQIDKSSPPAIAKKLLKAL